MRDLESDLIATRFRYRSEHFVIRLWQDGDCPPNARWRGRMQHVTTGEVRFFHDWDTFIGGLTELTTQIRVP
ncbi:MAG: hypothetical protein U0559_21670 [Anaerolineae bacterium]